MKKQQLFLLGSGRSGTTLTQRILNSFPEVMLWGEHGGFLKHVAEQYYFLKNSPSMHQFCYERSVPSNEQDLTKYYKDPAIWQAWINWFLPHDLADIFRQNIENFFIYDKSKAPNIWGFKEIRYTRDDKVIELLLELYPNAVFIVIYRDGINTIESQLSTFFRGSSKFTQIKRLSQIPTIIKISLKWKHQNNYYQLLKHKYPNNIYTIKYEDIINDIEVLNPVINKLGLTITQDQKNVLNMKAGRGTRMNSDVENRWRRLGIIPALLIETIIGATSLQIGYKRSKSLRVATLLSKIFNSKWI